MAILQVPAGAKLHSLKCEQQYFRAIERGDKTFEVRLKDRAYAVGDILELTELRPMKFKEGVKIVEGDKLRVRVTYLLPGGSFGIEPDHVVMAVRPLYMTDDERRKLPETV